MIYSFLRSITEVQAHLAHVHALAHQVRKIFFMGSFINIPLVRRFFTENIHGRNRLRPKASIFSHWVPVHAWWRTDFPQTLAHPREVLGTCAIPFCQYFSFTCSFRQKFCQVIIGLRPLLGLAPPVWEILHPPLVRCRRAWGVERVSDFSDKNP